MPEPWFKVQVGIIRSGKLASLSSDSSRWGWIKVLAEAKQQRQMGVFGSRAHLVDLIGRHGKFVDEYLKAGLAHLAPDLCDECRKRSSDVRPGQVVVHDYRREQRDPSNADRQADWYAAHGPNGSPNGSPNGEPNGTSNGKPNGSLTRAGGDGDGDGDGESSSSVLPPGMRAGKPRPPSDLQVVKAAIGERGLLPATGYVLTDLQALVKGYGANAVLDAFRATPEARTTKELVKAAERLLSPPPSRNGTAEPRGHTRPAKEVIDAFRR